MSFENDDNIRKRDTWIEVDALWGVLTNTLSKIAIAKDWKSENKLSKAENIIDHTIDSIHKLEVSLQFI